MQQEDSQELIKSVIAVATNSTATAVATGTTALSTTPVVDAGYIRLPQDAIAQAASTGKITVGFRVTVELFCVVHCITCVKRDLSVLICNS